MDARQYQTAREIYLDAFLTSLRSLTIAPWKRISSELTTPASYDPVVARRAYDDLVADVLEFVSKLMNDADVRAAKYAEIEQLVLDARHRERIAETQIDSFHTL